MPVTVGLGAAGDYDKIRESIAGVGGRARVVCFAPPGSKPRLEDICTVVEGDDPGKALVSALMAGTIDAAVRGTLPASSTLAALKQASGVADLVRIALLETAGGRLFFLAPVGVDEGWTISQKIDLVECGRELARKFGLSERVSVLSGGRYGDLGRHPAVDRTLADAELVARLTGADHAEILIEDAIRDAGLIVAPDGITGNLIFRTLTFLGGGVGHGAPVVNIDKIFVDTSRASPNYAKAILLAESLSKG
ncbi:phosphotransacetylase [Methanoculleus sp. FWC-SCC1]|uniref:Phosphotransacetylase n=1 Tax=Methanoculleus frigidifontis TaxID=2584085 RepID=A0ABT8M8E0_9EURY|nr:methanogenesis marker protein Mmp4/MtxX [Methanoculleus sp. FWC-SCC1]MDN7024202.1 phosphotransacetylase [Methanoculleus sp. FWC-SCC1]